ncbi:uncharacterized protein METZ01_LOCUS142998 [marine metagenome]|uniref:SPOR domain-containing protein n=1 Tax=marine metagenome TaxID=408172 RepID=A0A381ZLZ0_9ZZZZ
MDIYSKIILLVPITRISSLYYNLLILISLSCICINQSSCGGGNDKIKPVNKTFITKKKTFLYEDVNVKNVVMEIPEFTTLRAEQKRTKKRSAGMVMVYYKVEFNKQHGWVQAIYLAEVPDDEQKKDSGKRKSPINVSGMESITSRTDNIKSKTRKRIKNIVKPSQETDVSYKSIPEKQIIPAKSQHFITDEITSISNVNELFSVQVGSFKDKVYALDLAKNIRLLGFEAYLDEFYGNSGLWLRVRVGKYSSKEKAHQTANVIRNAYPLEPWIVSIIDTPPPTKQNQGVSPNETGIKTEYYTIQISSVKNKTAANLLAKKLGDGGYPSIVSRVIIKGEIWYRVRHGKYKMITVAKRVANELKNKFKLSPWISNIYK